MNKKYQIVRAPNLDSFEILCEAYIEMGYIPLGGLVYVQDNTDSYMQAFTKINLNKITEDELLPDGTTQVRF